MKRKSIVSMLIAFIMLCTVLIFDTSQVNAANKDTYWIKVNRTANVVTVYEKSGSKYVPIRAMLCSCGKKGHSTPKGTFRMGTKIGWCKLVGNVWGRYSMVIKGNYLFHSVPYKKKTKSSMQADEYNKLGKCASHGCVRMSLIDVKWIWDKCPKGTKITVYSSSNPGPLGKPEPIKMKSNWKWDPTDTDKNNKNYRLKKPVIEFSSKKSKYVQKGNSYNLKEGVIGKNPNAIQDLSKAVKVHAVYKYDTKMRKYTKCSFSTKKTGKYKITYRLHSDYCGGSTYRSYYLEVVDDPLPTISIDEGYLNREVKVKSYDACNAVLGVSAYQGSMDRTSDIVTEIVSPDGKKHSLSYEEAMKYVFSMPGEYSIKYKVRCKYFNKWATKMTLVKATEEEFSEIA